VGKLHQDPVLLLRLRIRLLFLLHPPQCVCQRLLPFWAMPRLNRDDVSACLVHLCTLAASFCFLPRFHPRVDVCPRLDLAHPLLAVLHALEGGALARLAHARLAQDILGAQHVRGHAAHGIAAVR
jgi:hypothetical protein